jgi:uncharacterized membrane protein YsdA (DUF1294 family)/cold shock CspA family protein
MRLQGKVTRWKDDKGFGFIAPERGSDDIFLHISDMENRQKRPNVGDVVTFELSYDERRRKRARRVSYAGGESVPNLPSLPTFAWVAPLGFFLFLGIMVLLGKLPAIVAVVYLVVSGITFAVYAGDKTAARDGAWRIPESTLLLLGLLGGWPGALVAQWVHRHKTRKTAFLVPFWGTIGVNLLVLALAFTAEGARLLRSIGK